MKQKFAIKDRVVIKKIKKVDNEEKINNDSLKKEQLQKEEK